MAQVRFVVGSFGLAGMIGQKTTGQRYGISIWMNGFHSADLRRQWDLLLALQTNSTAIYQSPAFFDFLQDTEDFDKLSLLTVEQIPDGSVVGIVPLRKTTLDLPFSLGNRIIGTLRLRSVILLGSEPMAPSDPIALDTLFSFIARTYSDSHVIDMDAIALQSPFWDYLKRSQIIRKLYHIHVLYGFRDCHCIIVPRSVGEYHQALTRKRRYNMIRQENILRKMFMGDLHLMVIDSEKRLADLFAALNQLVRNNDAYQFMTVPQYKSAALRGILHCFVLKSRDCIVGVALGTKAQRIYRVHKFFYDKSLEKYSPGSVLWQLMLKDIIEKAEFSEIDMGYGTPAYRFSATNYIQKKGKVLLVQKTLRNILYISLHAFFTKIVEVLKSHI
jgi:hypothetical protein